MKKVKKRGDIFYRKGLQFECAQCGNCCTGEPGYVWLSDWDIATISSFLGVEQRTFLRNYTKIVTVFGEKRCSLIEKSQNACIFWDNICTIYNIRPYQCRSFPFWKRNLISKREWEKASLRCPGINRGRVFSEEEIESLLENNPGYNLQKMRIYHTGD